MSPPALLFHRKQDAEVAATSRSSLRAGGAVDGGEEVIEGSVPARAIAIRAEVHEEATDDGLYDGGQLGSPDAAKPGLERREPVGGRSPSKAGPDGFPRAPPCRAVSPASTTARSADSTTAAETCRRRRVTGSDHRTGGSGLRAAYARGWSE
jgi:hypothetical protein